MKVAVDLRALMETGGKISGVENYVLNIANGLERTYPNQYSYFMNAYRDVKLPDGLAAAGKVQRSRIPNKLLNSALVALHVPRFERLYGDFRALWMPDIRPFAIKNSAALAVTVHDISPFIHPEFYSVKRRLWHSAAGYGRALSRADVVFAVSEYTKADIVQFFGTDPVKIKVVYPGVDTVRFSPSQDSVRTAQVRRRYHLPKRFVLSISTFEPRKNILSLVRAFEQVRDREICLVLAGRRGWLYQEIFRAIESSPVRDRIIYVDYVSEDDKPVLIADAEVVCYPSFYEGFGFQIVEAMACGVPVITSARTSMPEVAGGAAMLVEPYQLTDLVGALNAMLESEQLRQRHVELGLANVARFTWDKATAQIHGAMQQL